MKSKGIMIALILALTATIFGCTGQGGMFGLRKLQLLRRIPASILRET